MNSLLCWTHVFKPLPERHDRETRVLQILAHLHSAPPVVSDLADIKPLTELFDEGFDCSVVNDVSLHGMQEGLLRT